MVYMDCKEIFLAILRNLLCLNNNCHNTFGTFDLLQTDGVAGVVM